MEIRTMDLSSPIRAWHFTATPDVFCDGRKIPSDSRWVYYHKPVVICESGLHASIRPLDALKYASGNHVHLVEMAGVVTHHNDKLVASARRIIARFDASTVLRQFARQQALAVAHLWDMPDVVREYLTTGDESKRAAASEAAWAASEAARTAASAAWTASEASAASAAWTAASAAWTASEASEASAAWTAAWAAAEADSEAARAAARADRTARTAARTAARAAAEAASAAANETLAAMFSVRIGGA